MKYDNKTSHFYTCEPELEILKLNDAMKLYANFNFIKRVHKNRRHRVVVFITGLIFSSYKIRFLILLVTIDFNK